MRIAIGFHHRGGVLRARLIAELEALGCEVVDLGTDTSEPRVDEKLAAPERRAA
jgi:ribose 5-phosphate isomerase RpiB